jgi:hypothetical protein
MIWLLFTIACDTDTPYNSLFAGPTHSAILYPDESSNWDQPIGFVANRRSGTIVPLDLKHETALSDQFAAPFIRPRGVATGSNRMLGPISTFAPASDRITVYALDYQRNVLLQIPYITGMLPEPQIIQPTHSEALFVDVDQNNDSISIDNIQLLSGATTTETWTIKSQQEEWVVIGSRSGLQENRATLDTTYISDNEEISFVLSGTASDGDYVSFQTDTGLIEHDLGGTALTMIELDDPYLLISVWDEANEQGWLSLFNRRQNIEESRWLAPEGVQPWKMIFGEKGDLYIADAKSPQILHLEIDIENFDTPNVELIPSISIAQDLAYVAEEEYQHLFVATAYDQRIDVYDIIKEEWKNINPHTTLRGGPTLLSPVIGISASREPVTLKTTSAWGAEERQKVIIATLFDGTVIMLEGDSGCLATIPGGSSLELSSTISGTSVTFTDSGPESNPSIYTSDDGNAVTTSNCGGVLLDETWIVRFDGTTGDWEVKGSRSGVQDNRAEIDNRYISDTGSFSFTIVSGSRPPTDGDTFSFSTAGNALELGSVVNSYGGTEALELPGPPLVFEYLAGPVDGGWDEYRGREFALIPITNSDIVLRLRLETWEVEAVWN